MLTLIQGHRSARKQNNSAPNISQSYQSMWMEFVFFFFFCGRSAILRPSVHMLPGIGWCSTGLLPFPTACWWLTHPTAITGVSVSARWDSPGGCGGSSVLLLCNRRVQSLWCQFSSGVLAGHSVLFATWIYWSAHVLLDGWLGQLRDCSLQWLFSIDIFGYFGAGFWLPGKWRWTWVAVVCSQT